MCRPLASVANAQVFECVCACLCLSINKYAYSYGIDSRRAMDTGTYIELNVSAGHL